MNCEPHISKEFNQNVVFSIFDMSADDQSMEAASLYAEDKTFSEIATVLGIAKSHAQVLVRRGISLLVEESVAEEEEALISESETVTEIVPIRVPNGENAPAQYTPIDQVISNSEPRRIISVVQQTALKKQTDFSPTTILWFDFVTEELGFNGTLSMMVDDCVNHFFKRAGFELVVRHTGEN